MNPNELDLISSAVDNAILDVIDQKYGSMMTCNKELMALFRAQIHTLSIVRNIVDDIFNSFKLNEFKEEE